MSQAGGPRADLPFGDEVVGELAFWLSACGIPFDRPWLSSVPPLKPQRLLLANDVIQMLRAAREKVPQSGAHWEIADFTGIAVAGTLGIVQWGIIDRFILYRWLMVRLWTDRSRPYLPAIFAAAACMPAIDREWRDQLLSTIARGDITEIDDE